jgi:23S rRNA (cytosine1962-C5)-methyltransferase
MPKDLIDRLTAAFACRQNLFNPSTLNALRLFNGFLEGFPDLVLDIYGRTALITYYGRVSTASSLVSVVLPWLQSQLPDLQAVVLKLRQSKDLLQRNGQLIWGSSPDNQIQESQVRYAIDLLLNQDSSFYLDTRNLRAWIRANLANKTVLNTFAYTGSLGVAACAAPAQRVVQLDQNRQFLNLAKTSYTLNGFAINKADFLVGDFWPRIAWLKREAARFDAVIVDPPFFSVTAKGRVDLVNESARIINKVRPLINDQGYLIAINNALFVSGAEYYRTLESLCADGYLQIAELIPVPEDCTGYAATREQFLPTDPAPFNHATKIAVLQVRRKVI